MIPPNYINVLWEKHFCQKSKNTHSERKIAAVDKVTKKKIFDPVWHSVTLKDSNQIEDLTVKVTDDYHWACDVEHCRLTREYCTNILAERDDVIVVNFWESEGRLADTDERDVNLHGGGEAGHQFAISRETPFHRKKSTPIRF
jgi:hypothetical protein